MADIKYEITRSLGILSQGTRGWQKEINLISWNERAPKVDIRDWAPEHEKMGKGITLTREELIHLRDILNQLDLEELSLS
ncbi:MAG: YdbC family protein [Syntrophomonadaceae bacterium]|nr:PC4/YdbC family ssDNA-binding protein [Bacillota bacterium]NLP24141.1 hypothetical protein [Syntrophomonadaceae bacterium]